MRNHFPSRRPPRPARAHRGGWRARTPNGRSPGCCRCAVAAEKNQSCRRNTLMDIVIYRTEQADRRSLYNGLEFSAARYGARILGYVDRRGPGSYKGRPVYTPPQLAELGVDAVIAPAALTAEDRQLFRDAGWPGSRLLSYETHPGACVERFQCEPTWLPCDRRAVVGGVVTSET